MSTFCSWQHNLDVLNKISGLKRNVFYSEYSLDLSQKPVLPNGTGQTQTSEGYRLIQIHGEYC